MLPEVNISGFSGLPIFCKESAMKKIALSAALFGVFASAAMAQTAAPASPHTFSANIGVFSDYRFRGISQTNKDAALQGGIDYSHSSGFYLGNWNSNVSDNVILDGNVEIDLYGGFKFEPVKDLVLDLGVLQYYYPSAEVDATTDYDTTEVYIGATYKWFSAKYSHAVSDDVFGLTNQRGSYYLDLNANFEIANKTTLNLHVGRMKFDDNALDVSYTDWKVGVTYDLGFASLGLAYIDTNAGSFYTSTTGRNLRSDTAVLSLSKVF
jgi:uncharacterized protein (TIGR02001 family)